MKIDILLDKGTRVYGIQGSSLKECHTIERVTPVKAYANGLRFRRAVSNGVVECINADPGIYYRVLTEKELSLFKS